MQVCLRKFFVKMGIFVLRKTNLDVQIEIRAGKGNP
jgi:hypothetical protein